MVLGVVVSWLLLSELAQPAEAFGINKRATRWERGAPIEFVLNMANVPSSISPEQLVNVIQRAFAPWTTIPTAELPVTLRTTINDPSKATPQADGQNLICWDDGSTPRTDMVAGKAYPFDGECDILLQPQAPFTLIDVKAIVMHELGHCLGLSHSTAHGVMTKFQGLPTLGSDDAIGVSLLHPNAEAPLARMTASLTGRVERHGRPLLGAVLHVVDVQSQRVIVAGFSGVVREGRRADPMGRFELPGIPPGRYLLRVEPMDAFVAADPDGYGAPVEKPPAPFHPISVELPELAAGDREDVGTVQIEDE